MLMENLMVEYVEEIEFSTDCEEYLNMDAILVDPEGIVYDSSTRAVFLVLPFDYFLMDL